MKIKEIKLKERDLILNEEILNQIRLMNFDRSMTLLESEYGVVGIKNSNKDVEYDVKIRGLIQGSTENITEKVDNGFWSIFLNNIDPDAGADFEEAREHLFYGYTPLESGRANVDGTYDIDVKLNNGKYALIFRGYDTNSPVTYYFDVTSNINKTLNVLIRPTDEILGVVNLFTNPQIINLCNEIDNIEKKYNDLRKRNSSINKDSTSRFLNPRSVSFADDVKITYEVCKPFLDNAKKEFNTLKKRIERGEYYLKEANSYMENDIPSNVLPLDLLKDYGTIEGFNAMKGLLSKYSKKRGGESLWREWNNNDGTFIDPNRVVLSPEDRIKLEESWSKLFDSLRELYHAVAPWVAMVLWMIPNPYTKAGAIVIESIDAALYVTEGNYYMAGLCAAFTVLGVWSESWSALAYHGYYKAAQKQWLTITKAERIAMRRAASRSSLVTASKFVKEGAKYLAKRIIGMIGKNGQTAINFISKLLKIGDALPGILKGLISFLVTITVQVGATVWTWDKLASYLGICDESGIKQSYDGWNNDDHWILTNITLKPLMGVMVFSQTSTEPCAKERAEISTKEVLDEYDNVKIQRMINAAKYPQNMTQDDKNTLGNFYKDLEKKDKLNKSHVNNAENKLIKEVSRYEVVLDDELRAIPPDDMEDFINKLDTIPQ